MTTPSGREQITLQDRLLAVRSHGVSIRQLANLSGLGFGTVQALFTGATKNPTADTLEKIGGAIDAIPVFRSDRAQTFADDKPRWSADDLAGLVPPAGSQRFKLVFWTEDTATRAGSTDWFNTSDASPLDAVRTVGGPVDAVRRVIWRK